MKTFIWIIFTGFMGLSLSGFTACGQDRSADSKDQAIKVNNTRISFARFNELIKRQAYTDPELEITRENKARFADYLVQKELMIQEAVSLNLDQREDFICTIEKYWESTLIRTLLDLKTAQFKAQILVTQEDMRAYYLKNKDELGQP
ncbi:MAG: SurA N-terminal domain-containing protein [Desulfobacter sp.]|nr:SurA N-terminal domain-containing protein [Desulfobacter sp.]